MTDYWRMPIYCLDPKPFIPKSHDNVQRETLYDKQLNPSGEQFYKRLERLKEFEYYDTDFLWVTASFKIYNSTTFDDLLKGSGKYWSIPEEDLN